MDSGPWAFGWTQLLTLIGFAITLGIAGFGFRSFERWRRERLEEKKIDVALEALALAHESKYVFEVIRNAMSYPHEWKDIPEWPTETQEQREQRGPYYAILTRLDRNRDYFERLFKLQPRFMALFGPDKEEIFLKCHKARRFIEVSAGMLMKDVSDRGVWDEARQRRRNQYEADIWEGLGDVHPDLDRVSTLLREFQGGIMGLCEPVAASRTRKGLFKRQ